VKGVLGGATLKDDGERRKAWEQRTFTAYMELVMECPVRFSPYTFEAVPPLVLSAPHLLMDCLSQLPKADSLLVCPSCRKVHQMFLYRRHLYQLLYFGH